MKVYATDTASNESVSTVTIELLPTLRVFIPSLEHAQEGARIGVPIYLASRGEAGGLTFVLQFDRALFEAPALEWDPALGTAFLDVNTNISGSVRASLALAGSTIPAGTQHLATVTVRAKSIPANLQSTLNLSLAGIVSVTGDSLAADTEVGSGSIALTKRIYVGDNNANNRLDVQDATTILRLITFSELARPWDVLANDLNNTQQLDVGDVIRVLRAVVGLDPQPGSVRAFSIVAPFSSGTVARMTFDKQRALPGETVKLTVALSGVQQNISGASFRIRYSTNALRLLQTSDSPTVGEIVPRNALTLWNLAEESGLAAVAISTDAGFSMNSGTVAEFKFVVQSGAPDQPSCSIDLTAFEIATAEELLTAADSKITLLTREVQGPVVNVNLDPNDHTFRISVVGDSALYQIQVSDDLITWKDLETVGTGSFVRDAEQKRVRFYRAMLIVGAP